ncbi:MAG: carbohydrate kinase [Saprospiraceae bacterium]|nr:carbohydrate kinase [Saprospiraceae bacterium]
MKVTAVFDIGRTNKKFFLFDNKLKEVYRSYTKIKEIKDEDGFPCDDLDAITHWVRSTLDLFLLNPNYSIHSVNFSAYGASMVHVDRDGKPVAPLYSYLKPLPDTMLTNFYAKHGDQWQLAKEACSPPLGMLNSGLQPYWIKYAKPKIYKKIRWSLHLPQYLSFLFTGLPVSDYTSIGCHTLLWDFKKKNYHSWVFVEGIDRLLAPIVDTTTMVLKSYRGHRIRFGVGIHDSSSALLPYFILANAPFLLISTGTWSISMNPFSEAPLSKKNLKNDVLKFMQIDGRAVKASRLFLGNEYTAQMHKMRKHFGKSRRYHYKMKIDWKLIAKLKKKNQKSFCFDSIGITRRDVCDTGLEGFKNFKEAYHQLMLELVELQILSCKMAIGKTRLQKIFIDGGFIDNDIYLKLLTQHFSGYPIRTARSGLGSALGAAMVISRKKLSEKSLAKHYELRRQKHKTA